MDESTPVSRHPDSIRQAILWTLLPTLALLLIAPAVGDAQVATNITSSGLDTTVTQAGNLYNITGGTRPGSGPNLFHSFGDFSVGAGDIGNFLNNTGLPTSNILGRVTGGNISNIYGTIQTTDFGSANLFLVNPSGIVFGPNGSVNVGGSVSFTTAQYLRLFDGVGSANFYANPANDGLANSVLAVAPVVDFGFLSPAAYGFLTPPDPSATITVQGSALSVTSGQSISLVGGKVVIQAATLPDGTVQPAHLSAPNGTVQLASTASPGEFDVATLQPLPNVDGASFTSFGSVSLAPNSNINVSGASTVFVKSGQLVLSVNDATLSTSESPAPSDTITLTQGSSIVTSNSGAEPGADVQITGRNLTLDGSAITTQTSGDGNGGNIMVQGLQGPGSAADFVALTNGSAIQTITNGTGRGGNVQLTAGTLTVENGSVIVTGTFGLGRGGDVHLTADDLTLENFSAILTGSESGDGVGGDLFLNVGTLRLLGGSLIRSGNVNSGTDLDGDGVKDVLGVGGDVTVQGTLGAGSATDSVVLSGSSQIASETLVSEAGGRISITAKSLDLDEASTILSATSGAFGGGDIMVGVQRASLSGGSTITSRTDFTGLDLAPAGKVTVQQGLQGAGSKADSLTLAGQGSGIFSVSFGLVRPGGIEVHAKTVSLTDGALIQAGDPQFTGGTPEGVIIDADSVGLSGGSRISSQAFNAPAGQVTITVNALTLDNGSIVTQTQGLGRGGDVVLNAGSISLSNGAAVNSSSSGIDADAGDAGNVTIRSTEMISLDNSTISTTISGGTSSTIPATIDITAQTVNLANGAQINADTTGDAPASNITLNVDTLTTSNNSVISSNSTSTDSTAGNAGSITIQGVMGSGHPAANVSLGLQRILDICTICTTVGGRFNPGFTTTGGGTSSTKPATIDITAQTLTLNSGSAINAQTFGNAPGGNITLNVNSLTAVDTIILSSSIFSNGKAGNITIQGVNGPGSSATSASFDNSGIGTAILGNATTEPAGITITAHSLYLASDSFIDALTFRAAPAGNITVNVDKLTVISSLTEDHPGGPPVDTAISSDSGWTDSRAGKAGNITIQGVNGPGSSAMSVNLDKSSISTTMAGGTSSSVPANITIAAQSVNLSNGADITASTKGDGPAGNIELVTQGLSMSSDSNINSNAQTGGTGTGGSITFTGAGSAPITIAGGTIQAQSETSASAGNITLQAPGDLTLLGTTISVKNTGPGNAGSIDLRAGNDLLVRNSQVSTESTEASGGNIKLTAPNLVRIMDSTLTSSVEGQAGSNGGNIDIDPQFVVIQYSQLLANANAGAGGNITITATGAVLIDPNSLLSASAGPAGVSGSVNVNAPIQVLSGALVPLNLAYSQAALSGDRCAADPNGQFSSFVQTGRDGVPQVPGALSPSPLSFLETLTSGSLGSPSPNLAAARLGLNSVHVDDSTLFRFHSACRS